LAVNDHADADGSPAWMFKPLPARQAFKCCHHPLLVVNIQGQQDAEWHLLRVRILIVVEFLVALPAVKGLQSGQPVKLMPHFFFSLSSIFVETLDCWGSLISLCIIGPTCIITGAVPPGIYLIPIPGTARIPGSGTLVPRLRRQ